MNTNCETTNPRPRHPTVHEPEDVTFWSVCIEAGPDPLLVPRVLQKLAVPEIELLGLNFSQGEIVSYLRVHVRCRGALVRLAVAKLRKLVMVREARLS
jgi:hypothetical protein